MSFLIQQIQVLNFSDTGLSLFYMHSFKICLTSLLKRNELQKNDPQASFCF